MAYQDLSKSLFSLINSNGGLFKSEKQAKFLLSQSVDGEIYSAQNFHFGEFEGRTAKNTASIQWTFTLDDQGVLSVTKQSKKGIVTYWERTEKYIKSVAEQQAKKQERKVLASQVNKIQDRMAELEQTKKQLNSVCANFCCLPENLNLNTAELFAACQKYFTLSKNIDKHLQVLQTRWIAISNDLDKMF